MQCALVVGEVYACDGDCDAEETFGAGVRAEEEACDLAEGVFVEAVADLRSFRLDMLPAVGEAGGV